MRSSLRRYTKPTPGLGNFAFENTFVAGVAEQAHIHSACFVEEVFEGDVVYEVLREVFVGVGIGAVVTSDHNFEAVVE